MRAECSKQLRSRFPGILAVLSLVVVSNFATAADWLHWRGPYQTGFSPEKGLPEEWDPKGGKDSNLIWKAPYGCRSTPLVMDDKVYIIGADNDPLNVPSTKEKMIIGERVVCLNATTGKLIWEYAFNVFHSDIVTNRLGWAPLAADAVNKRVYAHSTAGFLFCFDATTGKIIWQRQLTEEFGRVTGYGGRIGGGPLFDSGLVIVGLVSSSWGNYGIGGNRFFAFDGETGKVVWISETPNITTPGNLKGTYYSNPVVAVIDGQREVVTGAADGGIHAYQVRTGKRIWSHQFAKGVINPTPVIDGNLVYVCHGEENPEGGDVGIGRVACLDAGKIVDGKPKVVWEYKVGVRFGLASPALADGKLYCPDDYAKLYCFDAKKGPKNGKPLWKVNFGTVARGAPVIADGKIFLSETNAKFHIIKLPTDGSAPDENTDFNTVNFKPKPGATGSVESHCTPAIANGKVYLANRDELFCIGLKGQAAKSDPLKPEPKEALGTPAITQIQVIPAELTMAPGESASFVIKTYNANGNPVEDSAYLKTLKWTLPIPPLPKGATQPPPALDAVIDTEKLTITVNPKKVSQQGYLDITSPDGKIVGRARVRVAPQIPYQQDFEKIPLGGVPAGWLNTQGKYRVVELMEDGKPTKVLFKVNDNPRPPISRANAYITPTNSTDYTIQADMKGVAVGGKLGDMGVIANRYLLILDPKTTASDTVPKLRLVTWEALPPEPAGRVSDSTAFNWQASTWYTLKLTVEVTEKESIVRGKAWERGKEEPAKWLVELKDPRPNREGAAALYGYVPNAGDGIPGAEIYYDNVKITPNKK